MRRFHIAFLVALVAAAAAGLFFLVRGWADAGVADVEDVPPGSQEVAWIAPATGGEAWERLVAALLQLQSEWNARTESRKLRLSFDNAFLALTAEVPEIALWLDGAPRAKLWFRWYKL